MRLSIRARTVLAMNLLVAAVGAAAGYAGIQVATHQVSERLVHESAANAARLIGRESLPLDSDALMAKVAQLLGAEAAAMELSGGEVLASSLSGRRREELARQLDGVDPPARVVLGGDRWRVGTAIVRRVLPGEPPRQRRFYLLVPEQRVLAAQRQVAGRIALFTLAAVVVATGVSVWLSTSISRGVRDLADRMDHLAEKGSGTFLAGDLSGSSAETDGAGDGARPPAGEERAPTSVRGPTELVRLTRSFEELLGRLAGARRQLEHSARLAVLGRLAGAVAHELRNPLSGIKMNARVLADELAGRGDADRSVELIIREIDRMDLYLQELLSVAASGASSPGAAGGGRPAGAVALGEVADSVVELLDGRCRHAGVQVERRFEPDAPVVRAEATSVRQVVLNFMLNALDAMPHGGRIVLSIVRGADGAGRVEVADTGPGVHVAAGADIFEPFVTTKPQGTGLGLYVCRLAVEPFGGRVGYRSCDAGAVFWLELPPVA